jgi:hypothetical protein
MSDSQFLIDFKRIIREANYTNTYKMAWGKALVELSLTLKDSKEDPVVVPLSSIASLMIKYYWNQGIFFNLIQGSNFSEPPLLCQIVDDLIARFYELQGEKIPVIYEKASLIFKDKDPTYFEAAVAKAGTILKKDVSYRFTKLGTENMKTIYHYEQGDNQLLISKEVLKDLASESQDLFDLINYRWSLILETFNSSPRINKKVRIMDERDIKRSPLERFDMFLDLQNPDHICFICGKSIKDEELSRDHVIPWSYLYSDDLWNIVYVHKSCNSIKSNVIPSQEAIDQLKKRNLALREAMMKLGHMGKDFDNLNLAIERDLVDEFYIGCKR